MMNTKILMTPGPTYVSENVRQSMAKPIVNPDIDETFFEIYKETTELLQVLLRTKNRVLILNGEGILGLEAACASLIEPNDKVLVISNGIFGEGFGEFISMYGGSCTYYRCDNQLPIDANALDEFLKKNHDFKFATIVHCETPSGLINPIHEICPILKNYNILSVVDAVSSIGGIPIETDLWKIDILLGASQKCLSAPPGLTFMSISPQADHLMHHRKTSIVGFYCNLTIWDNWYEKKWFPYTQPVSDIYALNTALKKVISDTTVWTRHKEMAALVRTSITDLGFELYPLDGFSDTVTAIKVPASFNEKRFRELLLEKYNILISGAFGPLEGKVIRIGHMGENCYPHKIELTLNAIKDLIDHHNFDLSEL